jgi:hypothetical protein
VHVDEAGGDREPSAVDCHPTRWQIGANGADAVTFDNDICGVARRTCTVDHGSPDQRVRGIWWVHGHESLLALCVTIQVIEDGQRRKSATRSGVRDQLLHRGLGVPAENAEDREGDSNISARLDQFPHLIQNS